MVEIVLMSKMSNLDVRTFSERTNRPLTSFNYIQSKRFLLCLCNYITFFV